MKERLFIYRIIIVIIIIISFNLWLYLYQKQFMNEQYQDIAS